MNYWKHEIYKVKNENIDEIKNIQNKLAYNNTIIITLSAKMQMLNIENTFVTIQPTGVSQKNTFIFIEWMELSGIKHEYFSFIFIKIVQIEFRIISNIARTAQTKAE